MPTDENTLHCMTHLQTADQTRTNNKYCKSFTVFANNANRLLILNNCYRLIVNGADDRK